MSTLVMEDCNSFVAGGSLVDGMDVLGMVSESVEIISGVGSGVLVMGDGEDSFDVMWRADGMENNVI